MKTKTTIQSVSRACSILQLLSIHKDGLSAIEISKYLNLNRSTTHHLLSTLLGHNFIATTVRGNYTLGLAIREMADGASDIVIRNIIHGILVDLVDEIGETSYLALFGDGVTLIDTVLGVGALRVVQAYPSRNEPAYLHARASGKIYLSTLSDPELKAYLAAHPMERLTDNTICDEETLRAELEKIRRNGYAVDNEEYAAGISCLAYPITVDGKIIGCVSVSYPSAREAKKEMIQEAVQRVCAKMSNLFKQSPYEQLLSK